MKKIVFLLFVISSILLADFKEISTKDMQKIVKQGSTPIIDIRRIDEYRKYGIIKGSHKITFFDANGKYDIKKWMQEFTKIVKNKKQKFVLVCAHANRTKVVGKFLSKELEYKNVRDLKGGINYGWIDKKQKTVKQ
jgi:rhodanese-related sulfurtransferase